jgi:hypothetical protein
MMLMHKTTTTKRSSVAVRYWIESFVWIVCTLLVWSYLWMFSYPLPEPKNTFIPSWEVSKTAHNEYNAPIFHSPPDIELWSPLQLSDSRLNFLTASNDNPDYGEIRYARTTPSSSLSSGRRIPHHNDDNLYNQYRQDLLDEMNEHPDRTLPKRIFYHDDELQDDPPKGCHRNNWKSKFYPSCNTFQEISMLEHVASDTLQYRGSGYFRDAWEANITSHGPVIILKTTKQVLDLGIKMHTSMAKEATILERLSASPRIVDIHGYCGLSMMVENMPFEIEDEIHTTLDRDEVIDLYNNNRTSSQYPLRLNNLTSPEKLDLALKMAESLADIHGFDGGIIVHADAHPVQWLRNPEGTVKLNDFNNAIVLDWSYDKDQYCLDFHKIPGTFHAPEEILGQWKVDDRADVFAMGACIFTIITGLYPFWEYHQIDRHQAIVNGDLPPIDPRYLSAKIHPIESRMLTVMEACQTYEAEERPSIFEIILQLRAIKEGLLL